MISLTGEYALRAIVFLACHNGEASTAETISQHTNVSVGYLAKILQGLNRSGLVSSQRGPHGGFTLNHRPEDITVYDVIEAANQLPRNPEPSAPGAESNNRPFLDRLHRLLAKTRNELESAYRSITIAELVAGEGDDAKAPRLSEP